MTILVDDRTVCPDYRRMITETPSDTLAAPSARRDFDDYVTREANAIIAVIEREADDHLSSGAFFERLLK